MREKFLRIVRQTVSLPLSAALTDQDTDDVIAAALVLEGARASR